VARPSVYLENGIFKMYYCHETQVGRYRIGYAESRNGIKWVRKIVIKRIETIANKDDASFLERHLMSFSFMYSSQIFVQPR